MKQKQLGSILIFAGILITIISIFVKIYRDVLNKCINCSYGIYILIWFIAGFMTVIGLLLRRSDELENIIAESKLKLNNEFKEAKKKEREKEDFQVFMTDFTRSEREIIEILHTYEGITLSELEEKAGVSNKKLARTLENLEKRKIITIMDSKIYLLKLSK